MAYEDRYSERMIEKLEKLKKKDRNTYISTRKKIDQIISNPLHEYKNLKHELKSQKRVHIGHFVLTFEINHQDKTIFFDDFDHHDNIYE